MYVHPIIITHLTNLFNMILMHGFVPDKFGLGVAVPVVKDKLVMSLMRVKLWLHVKIKLF